MPEAGRSKLRQRLFAVVVAGVGSAVAAAVSLATAIYEAAHPEPVRIAAAGEAVDTGRWLVTILGARMGSIPPTGKKPPDQKQLIMIDLNLANRSATTSNHFYKLLSIKEPAVEGLANPMYYLARDKWIASAIHPNMPERLTAVWEWPQGTPVPTELQLAVSSQIYKPRDNLYGAPGWFDREPAAIVKLPVTVEKAEERPR